jgi:diaminopimelate epimerase
MVSSHPTKISFCKYHGAGNDFILIDNRSQQFTDTGIIESLCHRRFGIGADGVILLEKSSSADFRMRIFNADGSEAEMCGNGVRCLAAFMRRLRAFDGAKFSLETMHRTLQVTYHESSIEVDMGRPTDIKHHEDLIVLDTGVPHAVLFTAIKGIDLAQRGPAIRYDERFSPRGVNVNFVEQTGPQSLAIRTYERGVEGETLACGTGCTAAALAAHLVLSMPSPIAVQTASKEVLTISFNPDLHDVKMAGNATFIFEGTL